MAVVSRAADMAAVANRSPLRMGRVLSRRVRPAPDVRGWDEGMRASFEHGRRPAYLLPATTYGLRDGPPSPRTGARA
ncbi:hypothetical protein GCM10010195_51570 [Kitasatospora griseola]|nr:hypothetical protein GCM10010195_51570 [Kitasatospora griseola]